MPRVFVALPLPDDVRMGLSFAGGGIPRARWTPADSMHLTLHFIGDLEGRSLQALVDAVSRFSGPSFELALGGVGTFGPRGSPRVLWTGVTRGKGPLAELHGALRAELQARGIETEHRKFAPHVTLARFGTPPSPTALHEWVGAHAGMETRSFTAERVVLYSSILNRNGSRYVAEAAARLS